MLLSLWNYLKGYVIISVSGFSVARFMNLAANRGIYLWDIRPGPGGTTMKVSIKGFKLLKDCSRKTKCRYRILERHGLPFRMHRWQKRGVYSWGVLMFAVALFVLSSFVWKISVTGTERINPEEIAAYCRQLGLKPGSLKRSIDTKDIADRLVLEFPDISWVAVRIKGTNAEIKISETIKEPQIVDRDTPTNIIANKPGIIESITVSSGRPMVAADQVVDAGDILISGEVPIMEADVEKGVTYVRAIGTVIARYKTDISAAVPYTYSEKEYTGEIKSDISLNLFGKNINMVTPDTGETEFEKTTLWNKSLTIGDFILPIAIKKTECREYKTIEKTRTAEEAEKLLREALDKKKAGLGETVEIMDDATTIYDENGFLKARSTLTLREEIGQEEKIPRYEQ